mmetsp:Transcript_3378/g.8351  ORF Transcript_3378/g.8351 Transcript_3378/m.8351 type:complete len:327 (-) Transcript_3378:3285-4265(-)
MPPRASKRRIERAEAAAAAAAAAAAVEPSAAEASSDEDDAPKELEVDPATLAAAKRKLSRIERSRKRRQDAADDDKPMGAVVYLGHVPYGFFEKQMRDFFTQFGSVGRVRLSRSPKTTNSRGYAFIEFHDRECAEIVADTMNNYLLFGRLLKCNVMPPEKVHPEIWKNAGRKMRWIPRAKLAAQQHNKPKTDEELLVRNTKLLRKDKRIQNRLSTLGIDYTFPGYEASAPHEVTAAASAGKRRRVEKAGVESSKAAAKSGKAKLKKESSSSSGEPVAASAKRNKISSQKSTKKSSKGDKTVTPRKTKVTSKGTPAKLKKKASKKAT